MTSGEAAVAVVRVPSCSLIAGQSQELLLLQSQPPYCATSLSNDGSESVSPLSTPDGQSLHASLNDSDAFDEHDGLGDTRPIQAIAATSPLLSQLGPVSPAEELTPAIQASSSASATSSPSRRIPISSISNSQSSTTTAATASTSNQKTSVLVLDWSRPRTAGAIFQSSSGVCRVHLQARPLYARHQASIERLNWKDSTLLASSTSHSTVSTHNQPTSTPSLPESPRRAVISRTPLIDVDRVSQIPLASTPVISTLPL